MSLTPSERSLRGRLGAYEMHSRNDVRETSAPGRAAANSRFERLVDPDGLLSPAERARRAEAARRAHMTRIALLSAQRRRSSK